MEIKANSLFDIIRDIYDENVDRNDMFSLSSQAKRRYIDRMQDYYFNSFVPKITVCKEEYLENLKEELNKTVSDEAVRIFDSIPARGKQLIEKESNKYRLYYKKGNEHGN